jgi:hypothetical protein
MLAQTYYIAVVTLFGLGRAKPTAKVLQYDDVIVADSNGSIVVMKDYEYELKEAREMLQRRKLDPGVHVTPHMQLETRTRHRRCDESVEYQVLSVGGHIKLAQLRRIALLAAWVPREMAAKSVIPCLGIGKLEGLEFRPTSRLLLESPSIGPIQVSSADYCIKGYAFQRLGRGNVTRHW